jgi:hypothetical protein
MNKVDLFLGVPLEDWFTYHPPQTKEREEKHRVCNTLALAIAKDIIYSCNVLHYKPSMESLIDLINNKVLRLKATKLARSLETEIRLYQYKCKLQLIGITPSKERFTSNILIVIQQIRMLANQSITMDYLIYREDNN